MSNTTKKKIISLEVRDEYILGSGVAIGAVGSHASILLRIKFNENWDALNIHATWTDAIGTDGEDYNQLLLSSHEVEERTYEIGVPAFATRHSGTVRLSFSGFAIGEDGEEISQVLNTASGLFKVLDSNAVRLDDEQIDKNLAGQVQSELVAFGKRITEFEGEMDARAVALENAENGYTDDDGNYVPGRVGAELEREKAEATRKINEDKRIEAEGSIEEQKGRVWAEHIRQENEEARLKAEGSADENSEYYGGRALAEKERQDNEEMRKEFYKTAFVGKKSNYVGGGVFNTEHDTANDYNLANARAATTFGFDNRIVNNEDDLKATHAHQLFKDDYVPAENKDSNLNESKWGRHSFLAGGRNVLTAYSGVGLGQDNKICGYQAVAIGHALRAYSARQLVVGKWNKPDVPPDKDSTAYGDYAFIVGNGKPTDPSNAFAVRWDGEVELSDGKTIEKHIDEAVDSAVAALVGSAPETMNTIGEIAKMIDDPDSAADVLGRLAVLDEQMGTVDEALDSIITIQNELIGGEA